MLVFAVAHYYVFSHKPYVDRACPPPPCCASFFSMCDVSDVRDDIVQHVQSVGQTVRVTVARNKGRSASATMVNTSEASPLLKDALFSTESSPDDENTLH